MTRKDRENLVYDYIQQLDPSGTNLKIYKDYFKSLSNKEFDTLVDDVRAGKIRISIIAPNADNKVKLSVSRNKGIMKNLGIQLFTKIAISDENGNMMIPNIDYKVMMLPVRRTIQTTAKQLTVAKDNNSRSTLSDQASGKSRVAQLSLIETQVLTGLGLDKATEELLTLRGGDRAKRLAMHKKIAGGEKINLTDFATLPSKRQSSKSIKAYFKAMGILFNT